MLVAGVSTSLRMETRSLPKLGGSERCVCDFYTRAICCPRAGSGCPPHTPTHGPCSKLAIQERFLCVFYTFSIRFLRAFSVCVGPPAPGLESDSLFRPKVKNPPSL